MPEPTNTIFLKALIPAALAALGYVAKLCWEWWQGVRRSRAEMIARLETLRSLLTASNKLFSIQQQLVEALCQALTARGIKLQGDGYEEWMSRAYPEMSAGEREQHAVIRSYSGHSLWEVNLALVAWLKSDQVFKMELAPLSQPCELAQALVDLEIHLLCWQGKLGAWIPGHPEHALVYMADEKKHGLGFPTGLDALVSTALTELQQKWRGKIT